MVTPAWIPLHDARPRRWPAAPREARSPVDVAAPAPAHVPVAPGLDTAAAPPVASAIAGHASPRVPPPVHDALGRALREVRISLTDRCNLRCRYCMPREHFDHHAYLPPADVLQDEEIVRLVCLLAQLGVHKVRLTGGEPLLRRGLPQLIARLAQLRTPQGTPLELCLTTNGLQLPRQAQALREAGLHRITVSLDALSDAVFQRMADTPVPVRRVLDGIAAAQAAGFRHGLKLNMVVQRGVNEHEVLPMARYARAQGLALRLIEYMDVGNTNGWQHTQVVPSDTLLRHLQSELNLLPLPRRAGETATRWAHADAQGRAMPEHGEIGFISAVTQAFCSDCTRLRLSADGQLYTCLFATQGHDVRQPLRSSASDAQVLAQLQHVWGQRTDRHSQLRQLGPAPDEAPTQSGKASAPSRAVRRIEMSYIGG